MFAFECFTGPRGLGHHGATLNQPAVHGYCESWCCSANPNRRGHRTSPIPLLQILQRRGLTKRQRKIGSRMERKLDWGQACSPLIRRRDSKAAPPFAIKAWSEERLIISRRETPRICAIMKACENKPLQRHRVSPHDPRAVWFFCQLAYPSACAFLPNRYIYIYS